MLYNKVTRDIEISVQPVYLDDESSPDENHFVWAYHVRIENHGGKTVQLINRRWHITDAAGRIEEVRGTGVVGEQPVLRPGEAFEYTSGTPLTTPTGFMVGSYEMTTEGGEAFDVAIPAFSLDSPYQEMKIN